MPSREPQLPHAVGCMQSLMTSFAISQNVMQREILWALQSIKENSENCSHLSVNMEIHFLITYRNIPFKMTTWNIYYFPFSQNHFLVQSYGCMATCRPHITAHISKKNNELQHLITMLYKCASNKYVPQIPHVPTSSCTHIRQWHQHICSKQTHCKEQYA